MTSSVFPAIIKATYDPSGGFPKMVQDAQNASGQIKRQFENDFGEIGRLAQNALALPRNAGGSLDLNVGQYKAAADNARLHATALRELANAASSAAKTNGDTTRSTQLYIQSANAAAREAEQQARAALQTASAYEKLQVELNRTKSATDKVVVATGQGTNAFGAHGQSLRGIRQASIQSAQQIQDLGISLYSGQRASTVFAQQLPQLAFALTSLDGATNKTAARIGAFATLLSGPLGSVALVGASIGIGLLVDKFFSAGDAADDATRSTRSLSEVLRDKTTTVKELTEAIRKYNDETERSNTTTLAGISIEAQDTQGKIASAIAIRTKVLAQIKEIENETLLQTLLKGGNPILNIAANRAISNSLVGELEAQNKAIKDLETLAKSLTSNAADELAKIASDPAEKIRYTFETMRNEAKKSIGDIEKLTATLAKLNVQEKAALEALKPDRRSGSGLPKVTDTEVAGLLGFSKFGGRRSASRNAAVDGAKNSYHLSGQAIDIPLTLNGKPLTKEGIRSELEAAGVIIKELLGPGDKGHSDHFHVAFSKTRSGPDQIASRRAQEAEKAARETERLARISDSAAESIARINEQFDDQPRLVDQSSRAVRRLQDVLAELDKAENTEGGKSLVPRAAELRRDAERAIAEAQDAVNKPFREIVQASVEQAQIDELLINNRELEAEILSRSLALQRQKGPLTLDEVDGITRIVQQERLRSVELERQRDLQQQQFGLLEDTQANLRQTVNEVLNGKGFGAIGNLIGRQFSTVIDGLTEDISESLFGDVFREQKLKLLGLDKVDEAGKEMASSIYQTATELEKLRDAARGAANAVAGTPANDNGAFPDAGFGQFAIEIARAQEGITVKGRKPLTTGDLVKALGKELLGEKMATTLGNAVEQAMRGAAYGQAGGGLVSSLGIKSSRAGSQVGGALGEAAFKKLAPELFKKLGDFAGPLGSIAGGILGSVVGGLFKKTKKGSTTISNLTDDLSYTGSGSLEKGVLGLGNSVKSSLSNIIESLNGTAGAFSVSIGQRGKKFVVDTEGRGRTKYGKKNDGIVSFDDEQEAIRFALVNAIQDGAVAGIKAGAQRLLQAGKDLDGQLQKAIKFQSVFDRLRAIKDPLGAAIDGINREFTGLAGIFKEAGASAAEFAQLEELYGLERAKIIKETSEQLTSSLRSLIDDLKMGDNGLSLRDRLSNVRSQFNPLAADIQAGKTVDFDKFSELARQLIEIQREISGSQVDYFAVFNEVLGLSEKALAGQANVIAIGTGSGSPFSGSAPPSNSSVPIVGAITNQTGQLLAALNAINANVGNLSFYNNMIPGARNQVLNGATYW